MARGFGIAWADAGESLFAPDFPVVAFTPDAGARAAFRSL